MRANHVVADDFNQLKQRIKNQCELAAFGFVAEFNLTAGAAGTVGHNAQRGALHTGNEQQVITDRRVFGVKIT